MTTQTGRQTECACSVEWDGTYFIKFCLLHAAAPDLLEAARLALRLLETFGKDSPDKDFYVDPLRAAIQKATQEVKP